MSLKDLLLIFKENDYEKELKKKLLSLEKNIIELKKSLQTFQNQNSIDKDVKVKEPPIIIEKINIEKIILDKFELNNNLGQLGIKELKGKLNIGATYGGEYSPSLDEAESNKAHNERIKNNTKNNPKVNIKVKKEENEKD
ncbi:hypothetical protein [Neobacillus jeddahensis]|uniref:hypothetical protein n=1 Tax=Neobacillus jeddahensis TaxID=1461580 RepID=UPI00058E5A69|nr:hypothetical protein [Neobacillus jeddahensis]